MSILELTEVAAEKARQLLASSKQSDGALRVAVRNGGCSGMRYELLFDETLTLTGRHGHRHSHAGAFCPTTSTSSPGARAESQQILLDFLGEPAVPVGTLMVPWVRSPRAVSLEPC